MRTGAIYKVSGEDKGVMQPVPTTGEVLVKELFSS